MLTHPTTPPIPTDGQAAVGRLALAVLGSVIAVGVFMGGALLLVNRADWWRGYIAASVAIVLAAIASFIPIAFGVKKGGALLVQMFMISTGVRGFVAIGLCALAVGVGHYPTIPTFALLIPYYLVLLAVEAACLARGAKSAT